MEMPASVSRLSSHQSSPEINEHHQQGVLLDRVLHTDETGDRSRHILLIQRIGSLLRPIQRQINKHGQPEHYVPYDPSDYLLRLSDGLTITNYDVLSAHGIYRAYLNCTDYQYNPQFETTYLQFNSQEGHTGGSLEFNRSTGFGVVRQPNQPYGWILSAAESQSVITEAS